MEGYSTENEQLEAFKQWWKKNGTLTSVTLVLIIAGLIGTQWWRTQTVAQAEAASADYQQLIEGLSKNDAQVVQQHATRIISQFSSTPYAPLAALALAKTKLEQGDKKAARTHLQWVLDNASQPALKSVARLRLAKIIYSEGEYPVALSLLGADNSGSFTADYEVLKGDIALAMKNPDEARAAYARALAALPENTQEWTQLQMKIDDLGVKN